jgi:tRNA nucleotidyltransferase (CCA-adding enzyme)
MQRGGLIERLPPPLLKLALTAGRLAGKSGSRAYLVGGIVRDLMLDRPCMDIDLAIEGDAVSLATQMAEKLGARPTVHRPFGTASLKIDGFRVDLATCRSETYRYPGALPLVKPGNLLDDLKRRDFTINAMAVSINEPDRDVLTDLFNGRQDLSRGLVRILHDKSFQDDATRMMRAVRYEQRLGFTLERSTARQLKSNLDLLDTISGDRLKNEVLLWLSEDQCCKILRRASQLGITCKLHPALVWNRVLSSAFRRAAAPGINKTSLLHFCLLAHILNEDQLYELLGRLNLTGGRLDLLSNQSLKLGNRTKELSNPAIRRSKIYSTLHKYDPITVQTAYCYAAAPILRRNLKLYLDTLRHIRISLGGNDLLKMGLREGPGLGTILNKLLAARLDGKIRSKSEESKLARRLAGL